MGLMDEIRKLTHPYSDQEDDYDDYDDEDEDGYEDDEPAAVPERPAPRRSFGRSSAAPEPAPAARGTGRVVNLNSNAQLQVVLVKPDRFDQVSDIADHLRDKKALVLNLESTNKDVARRLVDFLSGCGTLREFPPPAGLGQRRLPRGASPAADVPRGPFPPPGKTTPALWICQAR